ncbi:MAG: hypothetical protein MJ176_07765 [Treponema sp.]|nr:hypothetical protein [Treponema sp.]
MKKSRTLISVLVFTAVLSIVSCGHKSTKKEDNKMDVNEQQKKEMAEGVASKVEETGETSTVAEVETVQVGDKTFEMYCPAVLNLRKPGEKIGEKITTKYYSKTCEKERNVIISLPVDYTSEKKYPVLYVLHGIFGDEKSMVGTEQSGTRVLFNNLMQKGLMEETIIVYPYMFASKTMDVCTGFTQENFDAYDNFVNDLVDDLMPYMKEHYSIKEGRENTAVAGFSMGGREALAIGMYRPDLFGYICAVAPAPGLVPGKDGFALHVGQFKEEEISYGEGVTPPYTLILCGDKDSVVGKFPESYDELYTKNGVPHDWYVVKKSDHGDPAISSGFYNFCARNLW